MPILRPVGKRIGQSTVTLVDGTVYDGKRFEWWVAGHAEVTNDNGLVLVEWDGTDLEQRSSRESALYDAASHTLLATITTRGCGCGG